MIQHSADGWENEKYKFRVYQKIKISFPSIIQRFFLTGLGKEWGASPTTNPRETPIKELGSHLLQVR